MAASPPSHRGCCTIFPNKQKQRTVEGRLHTFGGGVEKGCRLVGDGGDGFSC